MLDIRDRCFPIYAVIKMYLNSHDRSYFTFHSEIFRSYGDVTNAGEDLQNPSERDLYRATPAVTRGPRFSRLIQKTRHLISVYMCDKQEVMRTS